MNAIIEKAAIQSLINVFGEDEANKIIEQNLETGRFQRKLYNQFRNENSRNK